MIHVFNALIKTLLRLFVTLLLQVGAVNAVQLDPSDRLFILDELGNETGATTWKPEKVTQRRVTLQGNPFDIVVIVHNDVAATWRRRQTAERFINNVTEMLELIYETERGRVLLDRFRGTGYKLRIFDIGSEPIAGKTEIKSNNTEGYRTASPEAKRLDGRRASLRSDSLPGPGTSSNLGLRKELVFGFSANFGFLSNRGAALGVITEELTHANRASWGVQPPQVDGLKGYKVFPLVLENDFLELSKLVEELEVAGEFPFIPSNNQIVPSYIPILEELKQRHPNLRFHEVGSYYGRKGPGWLDSLRFVDRFFRFRLRNQISNGERATILAALTQIEEWAHSVARATQGMPRLLNSVNRLLTRIELTKRVVEKVCS